MPQPPFIGRQQELKMLNNLFKKRTASLVVVSGRRRIGKSRLIEEFGKKYTFYEFAGTPPTPKTTCQSQLNEFARQLSRQTDLPDVTADDWGKLFALLALLFNKGRSLYSLMKLAGWAQKILIS